MHRVKPSRTREEAEAAAKEAKRLRVENDSVMMAVPEPEGGVLDDSEPFNIAAPGKWAASLTDIYERLLAGRLDESTVGWLREKLHEWGYEDFAEVNRLSKTKRMKLCDKMVRAARRDMNARLELLKSSMDQTMPGAFLDPFDARAGVRGGLPSRFFAPLVNDDVTGSDERAQLAPATAGVGRWTVGAGASAVLVISPHAGVRRAGRRRVRARHGASTTVRGRARLGAGVRRIRADRWRVSAAIFKLLL